MHDRLIRHYAAFLASPSDLEREREIVREEVHKANVTVLHARGVALDLVDYESYASLGVGRPQDLISAATLERCRDRLLLLVGILGKRLGTPTGGFGSGTVEEFEWAAQSHQETGYPEIKLYFRAGEVLTLSEDPDRVDEAAAEYRRVAEFRRSLAQRNPPVWYGTYESEHDFRTRFRDDLSIWINAPDRPWANARPESAVPVKVQPDARGTMRSAVQDPVQDVPEAPTARALYGRRVETETLRTWLGTEGCRLVGLFGPPGIGKSSIALDLIAHEEDAGAEAHSSPLTEFEFVIWRKLVNSPDPRTLLSDVISTLSRHREVRLPHAVEPLIQLLIEYLQQHRCLLVLDNFESLMDRPPEPGDEHASWPYEELLSALARGRHRSSVLITSRLRPRLFAEMAGRDKPVREYFVEGVDESAAAQIALAIAELEGEEEQWSRFSQLYDGNPLALELAARYVRSAFGSKLTRFFEEGLVLFQNIEELLFWQVKRLPNDRNRELELLYWLAINRDEVSLSELRSDLLTLESQASLGSTLSRLEEWLPISRGGARLGLQPVLLEYMTGMLVRRLDQELYFDTSSHGLVVSDIVQRVTEEILAGQVALLNTHAMLKAESPASTRAAQRRLLIEPTLERLRDRYPREEAIAAQLRALLAELRRGPARRGYATGNVLNLLLALCDESAALDAEGLEVRQLDLRGRRAEGLNLRGASLIGCRFSDAFGAVMGADISPDGKLVAIAETMGSVRVFDTQSGDVVAICPSDSNWMRAVRFAGDSRRVVCGAHDGTVQVWDLQNGASRSFSCRVHSDWVNAIDWAQEAEIIASASEDRLVKVLRARDGEPLAELRGHDDHVWGVRLSPDGLAVLSSGFDGAIRLWDVRSQSEIAAMRFSAGPLFGLAWDSVRNTAYAGAADGSVRVWDIRSNAELEPFRGHEGHVRSVCLSSDGRRLLTTSEDCTAMTWDIATRTCTRVFAGHDNQVRASCWAPEDDMVVTAGDDCTAQMWSPELGEVTQVLTGYSNPIWSLSASSAEGLVASAGEDGHVWLWDPVAGPVEPPLGAARGRLWAVACNADGRLLAAAGEDRVVRLWDLRTRKLIREMAAVDDWIRAVCFDPTDRFLLAAGEARSVQKWSTRDSVLVASLTGFGDRVTSIACSPGGLAAASVMDRSIHLLRVSDDDLERVGVLEGCRDKPRAVRFSANGRHLYSGDEAGDVILWDCERRVELARTAQDGGEIWSLAVCRSGRHWAIGCEDARVRVYDARSHELVHELEGHARRVYGLDFLGEGVLASADEEGRLRFWCLRTGAVTYEGRIPRPYEGMDISGAVGLLPAQRASLEALGAIDEPLPS